MASSAATELKHNDEKLGDVSKKPIEELKKGMSKQDFTSFVILLLLYIIQGIPMGFFGQTIHVLFIENGAHVSDLGALSLTSMPFTVKFLIAPFLDTYYFKKFGKRKSYIIPMQYAFGLMCFLISYLITDEIKSLNTKPVFVFGIVSMAIMAVQDVAVDGWAVSILSEDSVAYGSLAQSIGLTLGIVFAYNVFIPLNSVNFCNTYLYFSEKQEPLLTVREFWLYIGIIVIAFTFLVHLLKNEKPVADETKSVWETIKSLKVFIKNPNLRRLILATVSVNTTTAPIYAIAYIRLMQNGFPKEVFTNVAIMLIPIDFLFSVFISRLCQKRMELRVQRISYIFSYLNYVFLFWIVIRFDKNTNYDQTKYLLIIGQITSTIASSSYFVARGAFFNRICDESIGGTFLTTLAAISNLSFILPQSVALFVNNYVEWEYMGLASIILTPIYFIWFSRQLIELEKKDPKDFASKEKYD